MVKKLIQQRCHIGDIKTNPHLLGRKPLVLVGHWQEMERLLKAKPDMTLMELRRRPNFSTTKSLDFRQGSGRLRG
jgi:hypothetical protein